VLFGVFPVSARTPLQAGERVAWSLTGRAGHLGTVGAANGERVRILWDDGVTGTFATGQAPLRVAEWRELMLGGAR